MDKTAASKKDCEKPTRTVLMRDSELTFPNKLNMTIDKPTPTAIGSRQIVVGSAPAQPDSSSVISNCIKDALQKAEADRTSCLLKCSTLASQLGIDYNYIYWNITGSNANQASQAGTRGNDDASQNDQSPQSTSSPPNSSGGSSNNPPGTRNGGQDRTPGSGTDSNVGSGNTPNSVDAANNSNSVNTSTGLDMTTSSSPPTSTSTLDVSPIPPPAEILSNDSASTLPIGLILAIAIPALLLLLLLLFFICMKRRRSKEQEKTTAMGNAAPTSPEETRANSFVFGDADEALISQPRGAPVIGDIGLPSATSFSKFEPMRKRSLPQEEHSVAITSSNIGRPSHTESTHDAAANIAETPWFANHISGLYSEKFASSITSEPTSTVPRPVKMQSGLSSNGIYSLYASNSKAETAALAAAATAAALSAQSDSSISVDLFEDPKDDVYISKVSQDLRNGNFDLIVVNAAEYVQNQANDKRVSIVPAIHNSSGSSIELKSTKSFQSSKSTLSTRSIPLEKEIVNDGEYIPSPFAEPKVEILEGHTEKFQNVERQISNENTIVETMPVIFDPNLANVPELSGSYKIPDTPIEKEIRQIRKIDVPAPIPESKLEKSEDKKQFPVTMVSDTPGKFELKQEPKKQPTWMRKKQFFNPVAAESSFNPVSPDEEEDEDDIDMYAPPAPTSHVAIESYFPRERDEMYIQKGDLIGIEKEYGDGW